MGNDSGGRSGSGSDVTVATVMGRQTARASEIREGAHLPFSPKKRRYLHRRDGDAGCVAWGPNGQEWQGRMFEPPLPTSQARISSAQATPALPIDLPRFTQAAASPPPPYSTWHPLVLAVWLLMVLLMIAILATTHGREVPKAITSAICTGVYLTSLVLLVDRRFKRRAGLPWRPVPLLSRWLSLRASYRALWLCFALGLIARETPADKVLFADAYVAIPSLQVKHAFTQWSSATARRKSVGDLPIQCHADCHEGSDAICEVIAKELCPTATLTEDRVELQLHILMKSPRCFAPLIKHSEVPSTSSSSPLTPHPGLGSRTRCEDLSLSPPSARSPAAATVSASPGSFATSST